jgi:hypothetical protein
MTLSKDEISKLVSERIEDFRDGNLSSKDLESLRQLLELEPVARQVFVEYNQLAYLISMNSHDVEGHAVEEFNATELAQVGRKSGSAIGFLKNKWIGAALAASVLAMVTLFVLRAKNPSVNDQLAIQGTDAGASFSQEFAVRPQASDAPVAVLVDSTNARWNSNTIGQTSGIPLRRGWMELLTGSASLRFNSGAVVNMIAPAKLNLINSQQAFLASGNVVASVPLEAYGFQVVTNAMQLTDLGTEFAVSVAGSGETEVHVLNGLVEIQCQTNDKQSKKIAMREREAKKFADQSQPLNMKFNEAYRDDLVPTRPNQRIGYYTFESNKHLDDSWSTDASAKLIGGDGVVFHDFIYEGVVPGPAEFTRNLNRWSFKRWQESYRLHKNYVGFKVTASSGKAINLKKLSLELFRAGGNDKPDLAPQDGVLQISSDGFKSFDTFKLLDKATYVLKPKFVSNDLTSLAPAKEYEFRFLFKGKTLARAIRLDEVTLDLELENN